jgi:hypothetical protein
MIIWQKRDVHTNLNIYIFILKVFCLFQNLFDEWK